MNYSEHIQMLRSVAEKFSAQSIRSLMDNDAQRIEKMTVDFADIRVDFSKQRLNDDILLALEHFADECRFIEKRQAMFEGERINSTENRAVLHTALRSVHRQELLVDSVNIMDEIRDVLQQMEQFCARFHQGHICGYTNKPLKTIVNIGIGGSDLGPKMVCAALKPYHKKGIEVHFVSNVDGTHIAETLRLCNPETTLFIIASKTFTTEETMTNARSARQWFLEHCNNEEMIARHFIAVSTNIALTDAFGIREENVFRFWDWVGGRFSLWSAIGLPIALTCGFEIFSELLSGAEAMDAHFRSAPLRKNIPVMMALCAFWNTTLCGEKNHAVLPYDEYLRLFPAFLQQLEMESNGKSVQIDGESIDYQTSPSLWGQPGTDSQHSFFQLLHQGTHTIPADFIVAVQSHNPLGDHQYRLLANVLAQTEALMNGKTADTVRQELMTMPGTMEEKEQLVAHKVFEGNRPTTMIMCKKIDARTLGSLIAMYEHKVLTLGILWNINSFDQWGVELGKQLAKKILPELMDTTLEPQHDASTNALIHLARAWSE
ncbi:MAG: glucose-6-phosphate isomerase [Ignavibacteria bacterium]|jgi:glucose-6-phosphate isomerase|nr:glucose-6-phosphate isomerase [Ignavibacteria bacterium]